MGTPPGSDDHAVAEPAVARGLLLGAGAGLFAGLFGLGGGIILVPALMWAFALGRHEAHATSLAAILVTAPAALIPFALDGAVAFRVAFALAGGSLVGAALGAAAMRRLPAERLAQAFAVLLVIVAVRLMAAGVGADVPGDGVAGTTGGALAGAPPAAALAAEIALGLLAGVLSALLGVGGGVVLVPAMVFLLGFSQHLAEGSSLAVIIPTALVGVARHARAGFVRWRPGLLLGVGGVVGALLGAFLALALPPETLQRAFGGFLLVVGVRMLVRHRPRAATT